MGLAVDIDLEKSEFLQPDFKGFILNNPQKAMFNLFKRRHWLTIKRGVDGAWYNLDCKLRKPVPFPSAMHAAQFLRNALKENEAELLICRARATGAPREEGR